MLLYWTCSFINPFFSDDPIHADKSPFNVHTFIVYLICKYKILAVFGIVWCHVKLLSSQLDNKINLLKGFLIAHLRIKDLLKSYYLNSNMVHEERSPIEIGMRSGADVTLRELYTK